MLARPLALVLVACAAFTDTTGAHGAAFLFALAAMPALLVATLVALADVADARGARAKAAAAFQAILSVGALGLLGITAASSSSALLRALIPGTPVPALLACLGVFLVQWALAVSEIGRSFGRVETSRDRFEAEPESSSETRRRSQRRAA